MANRNLSVSFASYVSCVEAQVDFLIDHCERAPRSAISRDRLREYYENGVSVDAAAEDFVV